MTGVLRVVVGLAATVAMFVFWTVILVVIPMIGALYISRFLPLTGRAWRDHRSTR